MNSTCKNCNGNLFQKSSYCDTCGAKVITERITVKNLLSDIFQNVFGWDNKFFRTLKMLLTRPAVIFKEYINGTRKKYVNPFTFLGIGAAISLFVFNIYSDEYKALNVESNRNTVEIMSGMMKKKLGSKFNAEEFERQQMAAIDNYTDWVLKYFNLLVVLFLPLYTFLAFLVYRKPYNFGEHLVINSYIQGLSFLVTSLIFIISAYIDPTIYLLAIVLLIFYYTFAYGKLYKLGVAESILKGMIFIGMLFIMLLAFFALAFLIGYVAARLNH